MNCIRSVFLVVVWLGAMLLPAQAQPELRLNIQTDGANGIRVFFTASGAYQLEETTSLKSANWTAVSVVARTEGDQRVVTLPANSPYALLSTGPGTADDHHFQFTLRW